MTIGGPMEVLSARSSDLSLALSHDPSHSSSKSDLLFVLKTMSQMNIMTTGQDVVIVERELVAKWVIERNARKENNLEGVSIIGALLGSRAARLPWNVSVTHHWDCRTQCMIESWN
jgi:hypothetical protein